MDNFGAVRRLLLVSAVLTLSPLVASAQIVERSQTWANLIATHPCNAGLNGRHTILTDAQSTSSIGGGGGSTRVFVECDGVDTWAIVSIGGSGGGVSGLTTADGGTALSDNAIVRGDGTTGVQGSTVTVADSTGNLQWEGTTADAFEGNFTFADPTADWTWAWDATGNVAIPGNITGPSSGFTVAGGTGTTASLTLKATTNGTSSSGAAVLIKVGASGNTTAIGAFHDGNYISVFGDGTYRSGASRIEFARSGTTTPQIDFYNNAAGRVVSIGGSNSEFGITADAATVPIFVAPGSSSHLFEVRSGYIRTEGDVSLAADATNATATMGNVSGLTRSVQASVGYAFEMVLFFADSVAGEGAKFDFDGGTATATNFVVNCQMFDSALLLAAESTAIATDFAAATTTGASTIKCSGSFEVNVAGTFIPRAAQNSHATGTLTVKRGSYVKLWRSNFN